VRKENQDDQDIRNKYIKKIVNIFKMTKTYVLDIDNTLICQGNHKNYDHILIFDNETYYIKFRPWVEEFIQKLQHKYNVAVWSAGEPDYVNKIVDLLFKSPPLFVYTRNNCFILNNKCYKNLLVCPSLLDETFIIDDNVSCITPVSQHIPISPYNGDPEDIELLKLLHKIIDKGNM
jgi:TFIIF-interacting CTD phosphatase-like protein